MAATLGAVAANVFVAVIITHVAAYHHSQVSETAVKRILRKAGLVRRRGADSAGERQLEF